MKKAIALLLAAALCLCLTACDSDLPKDTFFADAVLTEFSLEGMPAPKLENSRLGDKVLYCNLTEEEYRAYMQSLLDYLQAREDIYHLGSYCSSGLIGEIAPYDVYSYIPEEYAEETCSHYLVFSMQEAFTKNGFLSDPIRVELIRGEEKLGFTSFTYNTKIKLSDSSRGAEFDPCYRQHSFDEGTPYPVPGMGRSITVYQCVHCGQTEQSDYIDSMEPYTVTVEKGRNYILRNNYNHTVTWDIDSLHAGARLEITVRRAADGCTAMLVNGEAIPVLREDENTQTFGFIMPEADVTIQILPASDIP